MLYYIGYNNSHSLNRHSVTYYGIYDDVDNTMSFYSYAKIKTCLENGNEIKGFENVRDDIIKGNPEFFKPETLIDKIRDNNYVVSEEPYRANEKEDGTTAIYIDKPVIIDRLVDGLDFRYKCLNVELKRNIVKQTHEELTTSAILSIEPYKIIDTSNMLMESFVECLEELAFCLSYYNATLLTWNIRLPKLEDIDLSLLDDLSMNNRGLNKQIQINMSKTVYLKIGDCSNKNTVYKFDDRWGKRVLKIVNWMESDVESEKAIQTLVRIVNNFMDSFGQVQISISDKPILDRVLEEVNTKHKSRSEGIDLKFLGTFNRDIGIGEQNRRLMGKMRLLGKVNTVFVVNLIET